MIKKIVFIFFFFCIANAAFAECQCDTNSDPYEPFNRAMFQLNKFLDKWILVPIATLYDTALPKPVHKSVTNFFDNLDMVPTIANDLLQGNFYQAVSDTWRFGINSTVGVAGFFDVASLIGLEPNCEDLGLTFAQWGYTHSNYLVLPLWGPKTFRDAIAMPFNYFLTVYPHLSIRDQYILYGIYVVNTRADLLHYKGLMQEISLDDYVFMRDAYLQRRNHQIERNHELGNPYLKCNNDTQCDKCDEVAVSASSEGPDTAQSSTTSATKDGDILKA